MVNRGAEGHPAPDAPFAWGVRLDSDMTELDSSVYTHGSLLDGPTAMLGCTGWAFLPLDAVGVAKASAHGVPPPWISTIFGAEMWAVLQAVLHAPGSAVLPADCKAVVESPLVGRERPFSPKRLTARAWAAMFAATDGVTPEGLS